MFYFELGRGSAPAPSSTDSAPALARTAASQALDRLEEFRPAITFVYMTKEFSPYQEALDAVAGVLRDHEVDLGQAPLVGGTVTALVSDGVRDSGIEVWVLASDHICASAAVVGSAFGEDREERIQHALGELGLPVSQPEGKGFLLTIMPGYESLDDPEGQPEGTWLEDASILDCIARKTSYRIPVFGGSTSDHLRHRNATKSRQFLNSTVLRNSVVVAWVATGLKFGIGTAYGYSFERKEIRPALITRFQGGEDTGTVIERIGDTDAAEYLSDLERRSTEDSRYLIGARSLDGSFSVAYPFRTERGMITVHPELDRWTMLVPMRVTQEDLLTSGSRAVAQAIQHAKPEVPDTSPAVILLSSCRGKISWTKAQPGSEAWSENLNAEVSLIRDAWPRAQTLGGYGTGEQGLAPMTGVPTSQTWSASALVLFDELNEEAETTRVVATDSFLAGISRQASSVEDLQKSVVTAVNRLVRGDGCSLFLRSDYVPWDPHDDHSRFVLVATSGLLRDHRRGETYQPTRGEIISEHFYRAGHGLTGWVAKYGITLRIDSRDAAYLEAKLGEFVDAGLVKPLPGEESVSPLVWRDKVCENRPHDEARSPFLAVPIKLGDETIAVVRISEIRGDARQAGKTRFSSFDEKVLELCSRYILAGIVLGYAATQRETAEAVARRLGHALTSRVGLVEMNLNTVARALGEDQERPIRRAREAVAFLKRAGELSGKYWRAAQIVPKDLVDVAAILHRLAGLTTDPRVDWKRPDRQFVVRGDADALEDVFFEILTNAREFTDSKTGRITVTIREEEGMCVVNVVDNGPGVHPSVRARLFQSFAAYPDTRLGMALALAHQVIQAHHGTITELSPAAGANFCVRLPLAARAPSDTVQREESP